MKIVISNVFGLRNKGDQALFEALREAIVARFGGEVELVAIASDPSSNRIAYPDMEWVGLPWTSTSTRPLVRRLEILLRFPSFFVTSLVMGLGCFRIAQAVKNADLVIACPGGYLEDSNWSYWAHLAQLFLAVRFGKTLILAPQSIGPIRNGWGKRALKVVLNHAQATFCREEFSFRFARSLLPGCDSRIHRTTDMVVVAERIWAGTGGDSPTGRVGLTTVWWDFYGDSGKQRRYIDELVRTIEGLQRRNLEVVIVPQTLGEAHVGDHIINRELAQRCGVEVLDQPLELDAYLSHYDSLDFTIGSRLHSCLLSIARARPAVCISYLPKCSGIMADLGLSEFVVDIDGVTAEKLLPLVDRLMEPVARERYMAVASAARERARESFGQKFLEFASGRASPGGEGELTAAAR